MDTSQAQRSRIQSCIHCLPVHRGIPDFSSSLPTGQGELEFPGTARLNITTPAGSKKSQEGSSNLGHQATPWRKGRTEGKARCESSPQVRLVRVTDCYQCPWGLGSGCLSNLANEEMRGRTLFCVIKASPWLLSDLLSTQHSLCHPSEQSP